MELDRSLLEVALREAVAKETVGWIALFTGAFFETSFRPFNVMSLRRFHLMDVSIFHDPTDDVYARRCIPGLVEREGMCLVTPHWKMCVEEVVDCTSLHQYGSQGGVLPVAATWSGQRRFTCFGQHAWRNQTLKCCSLLQLQSQTEKVDAGAASFW